VKIADFGLALEATGASLTQPGVMVGSLSYMPPEQMLGERVDGRGDLFSLGVVLFELLSGVSPYPESTEDDTDSLLLRMQKERHPRLRKLARGVPRSITRLVRGCMRAKVRKRIASVTTLRRSLERELGRPSPADCAAELATWLWERQVFDKRDNETVVKVGGSLPSAPFRVRRSIAFAAAATLAIAALGLAALHPELASFREELRVAKLLFP
jgi:serine/threonine-protein kinase